MRCTYQEDIILSCNNILDEYKQHANGVSKHKDYVRKALHRRLEKINIRSILTELGAPRIAWRYRQNLRSWVIDVPPSRNTVPQRQWAAATLDLWERTDFRLTCSARDE